MWPSSGRLRMPPCVHFDQLRYVNQMSLQVALVSMLTEAGSELWVFKSQASGVAPLYHELKVLLHQPPSSHIIDAPAYLVTMKCPEQDEDRVCGFLLKYYLKALLPSSFHGDDEKEFSHSSNRCNGPGRSHLHFCISPKIPQPSSSPTLEWTTLSLMSMRTDRSTQFS